MNPSTSGSEQIILKAFLELKIKKRSNNPAHLHEQEPKKPRPPKKTPATEQEDPRKQPQEGTQTRKE
jgi:hypothetical protein